MEVEGGKKTWSQVVYRHQNPSPIAVCTNAFFKGFLFIPERRRERQRHRQREKQAAPCGEPDSELDPGTPGSRPGPKAAAQPLSPPGVPPKEFLYIKVNLQAPGGRAEIASCA